MSGGFPGLYVAGAVLLTLDYAVLGWLMYPLMAQRKPAAVVLWSVPVVLLAALGLATMQSIAFGPVLVYVTIAHARRCGVTIGHIVPSNARDWRNMLLAVSPAVALFFVIYSFPAIVEMAIWRAATHAGH